MNAGAAIARAGAAEWLYAFLDGERAPARDTAVRRHPRGCAPCSARCGFAESFHRSLGTRPRTASPSATRRRVVDALDRERTGARR